MDTEFTPKYYTMDPETEDLLSDGTLLKNGMVVLIENDENRTTIQAELGESNSARAFRWNRWSTVSNVAVIDSYVSFIAVYTDGTKRKLAAGVDDAWYVKLDSIPSRKYSEGDTPCELSSRSECGGELLRRQDIMEDEPRPRHTFCTKHWTQYKNLDLGSFRRTDV